MVDLQILNLLNYLELSLKLLKRLPKLSYVWFSFSLFFAIFTRFIPIWTFTFWTYNWFLFFSREPLMSTSITLICNNFHLKFCHNSILTLSFINLPIRLYLLIERFNYVRQTMLS